MSVANSPKERRRQMLALSKKKLYLKGFNSRVEIIEKCPVCLKPGVLFLGDGVVKHKAKFTETTYCHIKPAA